MKTIKNFILTTLIFGFSTGNCLAIELLGIDLHGFASQGYIKTTDNNFFGETIDGTFDFNEVGLNFSKDFTDKLHMGFQILSRDFGSNGNNEINLDWGFADYRWKDWLGVRIGRLKAPKGLYNETRDIDILRTTIFLPQSVYPEIVREVDLSLDGGGIYGYIDLARYGTLSYQGLFGKRDVDANESASQALMGTTAVYTPFENDNIQIDNKYVIGLMWETPLDGLRMGATYDSSDIFADARFTTSGMWGAPGKASTDFKTYRNTVISAEYIYGDLVLATEYIRTDKKFDLIFPYASDTEEMTTDGWYLSSTYRFKNGFALGAYYSESYNDTDDRDGKQLEEDGQSVPHRAYFKDICLTAMHTINYNWSLKLEGHHFTGTNGVSPLDQVPDANGDVFAKENWNLFAAKITVSF